VRAEGIHCITVPTPFEVGSVNCWLVDDDPLTLVDAGPMTTAAMEALETQLAGLGRRVEDLEQLVITHHHADHFGLAAEIVRRSGAEVVAHGALSPVLSDPAAASRRDLDFAAKLARLHGAPASALEVLAERTEIFLAYVEPVHVDRRLADGARIELARRTLEVLTLPGHTPADIALWEPEERLLIAGDHLLEGCSSCPAPTTLGGGYPEESGKPRPLLSHLRSLVRTQELEPALVLPGHGHGIGSVASVIDFQLDRHWRKANKVARAMEMTPPRSAFEIARRLWGRFVDDRPDHALAEIIGTIDLLVCAGRVTERAENGRLLLELP
jgi:glyoxylase-like metal-dependent hydrolase (beta-lactamase superfamily II)